MDSRLHAGLRTLPYLLVVEEVEHSGHGALALLLVAIPPCTQDHRAGWVSGRGHSKQSVTILAAESGLVRWQEGLQGMRGKRGRLWLRCPVM